jgi:hypothetical protein
MPKAGAIRPPVPQAVFLRMMLCRIGQGLLAGAESIG